MSDRVVSSWREWLKLALPSALVACTVFWLAWQFVKPAPPDKVVIATGSATGVYAAVAQRYAERFAEAGIELEIRHTKGSGENYALLGDADSGVDVAIVQGGTLPPTIEGGDKPKDLEAVASIYLEPLWLLHRTDADITSVQELLAIPKVRIAIGADGSGTRVIARTIAFASGYAPTPGERRADEPYLLSLGGEAAAKALKAGEIDAAFFVIAPDAPMIADLLADKSIKVASLRRADAYTRRYRYLQQVTLPEGAVDLARNLPSEDVQLIAATASIVVRSDTHPAVVQLLVHAARAVHKDGDLLSPPGEFPSGLRTELPIGDEAQYHLDNPPNVLHRNLPFWLASLIDRMVILIIPLLFVLIPLARLMPPVYRWRIRSRIYRWYARLRRFDDELIEGIDAAKATAELAKLRELEREVAAVKVPLSYMEEFYNLRLHMGYMRNRLESMASGGPDSPID